MSLEEDLAKHTDRLVFRADKESEATIYSVGWMGPWPPPEVMFTATGIATGETTAFSLDGVPIEAFQAAVASPEITMHRYVRESASEIAEPVPPGQHWCRAALYVLDADG